MGPVGVQTVSLQTELSLRLLGFVGDTEVHQHTQKANCLVIL